ncbi:ThiF domain-containing protein [Trichostrongylus colubriformis]|uniref:ThiF domain-containing protein n=1 Tax=Trichostrongylus colubriformis TaxID=6319 RepID=A0AAN8EVG0_TRICO
MLENFKGLDRRTLFQKEACKVWQSIESGEWMLCPKRLISFIFTVLILGAGTLGSNIARCLMAWGVKKITFVDNSFVAIIIQQSLSDFADARETRSKAETAAAALQQIYPYIESEAVLFIVPMPGHTVAPSEELLW